MFGFLRRLLKYKHFVIAGTTSLPLSPMSRKLHARISAPIRFADGHGTLTTRCAFADEPSSTPLVRIRSRALPSVPLHWLGGRASVKSNLLSVPSVIQRHTGKKEFPGPPGRTGKFNSHKSEGSMTFRTRRLPRRSYPRSDGPCCGRHSRSGYPYPRTFDGFHLRS